jgi:hydroxymethylbilane synthase
LALIQSRWVQNSLQQKFPELRIELQIIQTKGDKILDTALSKIGDKGLFTREIETALLENRIDLAVHSLKDLPTDTPEGLQIAAIPARQDPADVLISKNHLTLLQLPHAATVLTSSLRRQAQLLHLRPDLQVTDVRGNVATRLRKLTDGDAHAMVMAAAGLNRLGIQGQISERLDPLDFIPACGQGALAIEIRKNDTETDSYVRTLDDSAARATVTAERTVLAILEGGCQVPVGAYARIQDNQLHLKAMIADLDGKGYITAEKSGLSAQPEMLGRQVAQSLLEQGGKKILDRIRMTNE